MYTEPYAHTFHEEFDTTNRDLENYLFVRDIRFHRSYRGEDCMVHWVYRKTPMFMKAFRAYQDQQAKRIEEKRRKANAV